MCVGNNPTFNIEVDKMNRFKIFSRLGIALLIGASSVSVHAEEGDITQDRTHDRTRTQLNLQVPTSDFGQVQKREEHAVMNQNQHQYRYMNNFQNGKGDSGEGSMKNREMAKNSWQGNTSARSMNSISTNNRYMQGSSTAGRSTGRGRH
jgi:hypothetical protein